MIQFKEFDPTVYDNHIDKIKGFCKDFLTEEQMNKLDIIRQIDDKNNVFFAGFSGSGKDTASDFLRDNYHYAKFRLAKVIKEIITECNNITMDELDVLKRTDKNFRVKHHEVSKYLREQNPQYNITRCFQLITKESAEFELCDDLASRPAIICDVRCLEEAFVCMLAGYTGFFFTKRNEEYIDKTHFTEKSMFDDVRFVDLLNMPKLHFIDNGKEPYKVDGCDERNITRMNNSKPGLLCSVIEKLLL